MTQNEIKLLSRPVVLTSLEERIETSQAVYSSPWRILHLDLMRPPLFASGRCQKLAESHIN